jgi:hypothetical protein
MTHDGCACVKDYIMIGRICDISHPLNKEHIWFPPHSNFI